MKLAALNNYEFLNILPCNCQVKLQKYYTEAGGVKYKNGLHCATRILQMEEVLFLNFFPDLPLSMLYVQMLFS